MPGKATCVYKCKKTLGGRGSAPHSAGKAYIEQLYSSPSDRTTRKRKINEQLHDKHNKAKSTDTCHAHAKQRQ